MASGTKFEQFIAEEIARSRGHLVPVKASLAERMFVRKAHWEKLHPNPDDEFCVPSIGPNYKIISDYAAMIIQSRKSATEIWKDPIIVEKVYPDGYMILNGHHRWGAAVQTNFNPLAISIVNLTQETDIERMLSRSRHNKRVTLDLDEVIFCQGEDEPAEKPLPFPYNRFYKERIRCGIPALLHYLSKLDYDVWVYTAKYYSFEYIRAFFRHYSVRLDGIITGTARKAEKQEEENKRLEAMMRNQYEETLMIAQSMVVRTGQIGKRYEVFQFEAEPSEWSQTVMDVLQKLSRKED